MITAWQRCLERLQAELPVEEYLTWLKPLQAHGDDNSLVLYAPNQFVADTVRERHLERLNELLPHFAGGNPTLRIAVGAVPRPVVASSPSAPSSAKRVAEGANGGRSGLDRLEQVLGGIDGLGFVRLTGRDVVRHKIVADIVDAYERSDRAADRGGEPS